LIFFFLFYNNRIYWWVWGPWWSP